MKTGFIGLIVNRKQDVWRQGLSKTGFIRNGGYRNGNWFKTGFGTELLSASRLYSQYCQLFTNSLFAQENASNNVLQTIKSFVFIAQNFYLFAKIPSRASIDMTNSTKK